ncbi:MAG: SHOCT domain-containing protein [Dehalococcoidia bacterium]
MVVLAGIWIMIGLPALALAPLAVERGRSPWWGLLGLASLPGLVIGLICLFSMEPGNQPERIAYARLERGEITPDEYERILAVVGARHP